MDKKLRETDDGWMNGDTSLVLLLFENFVVAVVKIKYKRIYTHIIIINIIKIETIYKKLDLIILKIE